MITIEMDDDAGYFMLIDDGIGLAKSKSRNVLVRIRDALNAVRETSLTGLAVEYRVDTMGTRIDGYPRGVVLAFSTAGFLVRLSNNKLDEWPVRNCHIVEPERPTTPTPWNDPAIGIYPAVELLKRVVTLSNLEDRAELALAVVDVAEDAEKFLKAREIAQPT
jgi:hypothetical protein